MAASYSYSEGRKVSPLRFYSPHDAAEQKFYELEMTGTTSFESVDGRQDTAVLSLVREWRDTYLKGKKKKG